MDIDSPVFLLMSTVLLEANHADLGLGKRLNKPAARKGAILGLSSSTSSQETLVEPQEGTGQIERKMGDTELSYYLPARESGVNDM